MSEQYLTHGEFNAMLDTERRVVRLEQILEGITETNQELRRSNAELHKSHQRTQQWWMGLTVLVATVLITGFLTLGVSVIGLKDHLLKLEIGQQQLRAEVADIRTDVTTLQENVTTLQVNVMTLQENQEKILVTLEGAAIIDD